jgi:hypothetical protein
MLTVSRPGSPIGRGTVGDQGQYRVSDRTTFRYTL